MKDYQIAILLATYNGEKFIREQLDSILAQIGNDDEVFYIISCCGVGSYFM